MVGWLDEANTVDIADVFQHLGIEVLRGGTAGPCPHCGEERRGSSDRRGAMNLRGQGWKCHRGSCGQGGDGLDAVAFRLYDRRFRDLDKEDMGKVREWYADRGWCRAPSSYQAPLVPPRPQPVRRREAGDDAGRAEPPPVEEVETFWAACRPLADSHAGSAWATARGFPTSAVAALGFPLLAPELEQWPTWWPGRWADEFSLIFPSYDARGALRTVHGRRVPRLADGVLVCEADECGQPLPTYSEITSQPRVSMNWLSERCDACGWKPRRKTTWPLRVSATGMLFADAGGVALLRGEPSPKNVLVVEGVTDLLRAALVAERVPCAVIGFTSGGAKALGDINWPEGARVGLATDPDRAGEKYADEVAEVLPFTPLRILWDSIIMKSKGATTP